MTEKVRRKPYSVVLIDEIEKAHPDVFNILLQVLDEGVLTDGMGFIPADDATGNYKAMKSTIEDALKRVFNLEFLNRIDDIVVLHQLEKSTFC